MSIGQLGIELGAEIKHKIRKYKKRGELRLERATGVEESSALSYQKILSLFFRKLSKETNLDPEVAKTIKHLYGEYTDIAVRQDSDGGHISSGDAKKIKGVYEQLKQLGIDMSEFQEKK